MKERWMDERQSKNNTASLTSAILSHPIISLIEIISSSIAYLQSTTWISFKLSDYKNNHNSEMT